MSALETAVADLAEALETLEARLESRLAESGDHSEFADAVRRQARSAGEHADVAGREIGVAVSELKAMLGK